MDKRFPNRRRLITCIVGVLLTAAGATAAVPGDQDADGIPDVTDNCLTLPNRSQRDSDGDGFGNACDADLNDDGIVDARDQMMLTAHLDRLKRNIGRGRPEQSSTAIHASGDCAAERSEAARREPAEPQQSRDVDLNEDGEVDARDLKILLSLKGMPPGPRLDSDGDKTPDLEDPCRNTPRGAAIVLRGCSALDLVENPNALLGPLGDVGGELIDAWRPAAELSDALASLESAVAAIRTSTKALRAGDPCAGKAALGDALAAIDRAAWTFPALYERRRNGLTRDDAFDDATLEGEELQNLASRLEDVRNLRYETAVVADAIGNVCSGARGGVMVRGKVRKIYDDLGRVELADGRVLSLTDPATRNGFVDEGVEIEAQGVDLGGGLAAAQVLTGEADATEGNSSIQCLFLRFVPVQPPASPPVAHDPQGYFLNGWYEVERGAGFAVADGGCAMSSGPRSPAHVEYKMLLRIRYFDGGNFRYAPFLLWVLRPGDAPVTIGDWFDTQWALPVLEATTIRRTCQLGTCQNEAIGTQSYPLEVRERGAYCTAFYDDTEFDVDEQITSAEDFRTANFFTLHQHFVFAPNWHFAAEAFAADGTHTVHTIHDQEPFAIHSHDFYAVMPPPAGVLGQVQKQASFFATGVRQPAGLQWPRATGVRNGHPFQYSCGVPRVIRDVVNFCSTAPNAYYRLPFASGAEWDQGPANHELNTSHEHYYAYDMFEGCSAEIRAMRGGRVMRALSGNDCQDKPSACSSDASEPICGSNCCGACEDGEARCDGNQVWIRHQDGSIAIYRHLEPGGVLVQEGDLVRRGQRVGRMGRSGNAGGTHLHTGVRAPGGSANETILALFEVVDPRNRSNTLTCFEPHHHDTLVSNNVPFN